MSTNFIHRKETTLLPKSDPFVTAMGMENRPVLNGAIGGQYGYSDDFYNYLNSEPHVTQQGYCVVLSTPAGFDKLPGGQRLHALVKAMLENRTESFEGLTLSVENTYAEQVWTGKRMSVPTGSTRSIGEITHNLTDIRGEVFTKTIKIWGDWLISDPDLRFPKIITLPDPGDLLIDERSVSAIYFEPTENCRDVAHAALVVGAMPKNQVPLEIKRNKEEENEVRKISLELTGLVEFDTLAAKQIARQMLSLMPLFNPAGVAPPAGFTQRTAAVESATESGTIENMIRLNDTVENPNYMG